MNNLQYQLFNDLMTLVEDDEAFFYRDQVLNPMTHPGNFRIFDYRLASYQQWLKPGALECRGVTFLMDENFDHPVALVSWPFPKFFNYRENPFTMDLDLSRVTSIQEKVDGSLISTFYFDGRIYVKSKGSLHSEQAQAAQRLLESIEYRDLYHAVEHLTTIMNSTVIMEYTSPDNRIVIPSDQPTLTVLGVRNNDTGEYITEFDYLDDYIRPFMVRNLVDEVDDVDAFVLSIGGMTGIEGYVVTLENRQRVKIKTEWYSALHHLKDSINSQRRLFEAAVNGATDDLKAQFYDDEQALALIEEMEVKVSSIYNHMVDQVERFYHRNKHLERKEYAIKGQKELDGVCFGLAMALYSGKSVDYHKTMIKHRKSYGIKDDPVQLEA